MDSLNKTNFDHIPSYLLKKLNPNTTYSKVLKVLTVVPTMIKPETISSFEIVKYFALVSCIVIIVTLSTLIMKYKKEELKRTASVKLAILAESLVVVEIESSKNFKLFEELVEKFKMEKGKKIKKSQSFHSLEPTSNFDRTNLDFIWDPTESPTAAMRFKHTLIHNNFNQTCFIDQMVNNSFLN